MDTKVVVAGCGFAGLTAARKLSKQRHIDLTLIDRENDFSFKPLLADVIGDRIPADALLFNLPRAARRLEARFSRAKLNSIDRENRILTTDQGDFEYDYALITSGAESAFRGRDDLRSKAFKLDTVTDVISLNAALQNSDFENAFVLGAGYTGVEAATNLRLWSIKNSRRLRVCVVEIAGELLPGAPQWMREYTERHIVDMNIDMVFDCSVESYIDNRIILTDGQRFDNALLVWSAGQQATWGQNRLRSNTQGRLLVDKYMQVEERCFAAGDAAVFLIDGHPMRMAVQISIDQGSCAAGNIIAQIKGRPMKPYKPRDLGIVIPLANNCGCGQALGINIKGRLPVWLHYLMSAFRSFGNNNRPKILKAMLSNKQVRV